jgi:hypothetical protein
MNIFISKQTAQNDLVVTLVKNKPAQHHQAYDGRKHNTS